MRATTATKAEVKDTSKTSFGAKLLVISFRIAFILSMIVILSVMVWAFLAVVGGVASSGDPLSMVQEWFKAITGK